MVRLPFIGGLCLALKTSLTVSVSSPCIAFKVGQQGKRGDSGKAIKRVRVPCDVYIDLGVFCQIC